MAKSNTAMRAEFIRRWGYLSIYADLKNIRFIIPHDGGIRTAAHQHHLFKMKRSKCDGYEKVSKHQLGLAYDIAILDREDDVVNEYGDHPGYAVLGKMWEESQGSIWGGNFKSFKDIFHFEL